MSSEYASWNKQTFQFTRNLPNFYFNHFFFPYISLEGFLFLNNTVLQYFSMPVIIFVELVMFHVKFIWPKFNTFLYCCVSFSIFCFHVTSFFFAMCILLIFNISILSILWFFLPLDFLVHIITAYSLSISVLYSTLFHDVVDTKMAIYISDSSYSKCCMATIRNLTLLNINASSEHLVS